MTGADVLARILTLRVDLRDEAACAEISPEMAERYLRAHGWALSDTFEGWTLWRRGIRPLHVPHDPTRADYGWRMCEAVKDLADVEQRSPIAAWVDMMGLAPGEKA